MSVDCEVPSPGVTAGEFWVLSVQYELSAVVKLAKKKSASNSLKSTLSSAHTKDQSIAKAEQTTARAGTLDWFIVVVDGEETSNLRHRWYVTTTSRLACCPKGRRGLAISK